MAGEVFIARQDTLETVKGTVDGIDSGVKQTNNALGNFSGGGTDTVKTELETMKNNMAQLQTKVDQLQSLVEQLMNKGGGITKFNYVNVTADGTIKTYKTKSYGILIGNRRGTRTTSSELSIDTAHGGLIEWDETDNTGTGSSDLRCYTCLGFFLPEATIEVYSSKKISVAHIFEFI